MGRWLRPSPLPDARPTLEGLTWARHPSEPPDRSPRSSWPPARGSGCDPTSPRSCIRSAAARSCGTPSRSSAPRSLPGSSSSWATARTTCAMPFAPGGSSPRPSSWSRPSSWGPVTPSNSRRTPWARPRTSSWRTATSTRSCRRTSRSCSPPIAGPEPRSPSARRSWTGRAATAASFATAAASSTCSRGATRRPRSDGSTRSRRTGSCSGATCCTRRCRSSIGRTGSASTT